MLVSTQDQADRFNEALDDPLPGGAARPVIGIANALQGLEYDLMFVRYSMAGQPQFDSSWATLSPRRDADATPHGCVVVRRVSDHVLFDDALPPRGLGRC